MNQKINHKTIFHDLGIIDYKKAWDYQEELFAGIVDRKLKNRDITAGNQKTTPNYLLFCQHPHVYTLGKSGDPANLLLNDRELREKNIAYYKINRGGDITYHGPGQLVGYPILDLDNFFTDIYKYLRFLEEAVIRTLHEFGIEAGRIAGLTGVWIDHVQKVNPRKICAIGVKSSRWVTMHGFAFNINSDLSYFDYIVPCGIRDKSVTSMSAELQKEVDMDDVKNRLKKHLTGLFHMELIEQEKPDPYFS
ncbi:MAG: lipoyl(octanoyl) transferase LipB [Cyclobacteriaceae bacterium]|nr:lipoyl(octanoyl) transferase LipB [Cyclobacteriaceae bacterium]